MRNAIVHFVVGILCVACIVNSAAAENSTDNGVFPEFTLSQNTGQRWHLSEYNGQPKLLMFWATWCPYCRRLFPVIQEIHEQYADDGLTVVAISIRDDGDTLAYARKHGLTMDIVVEGDALADRIGVPGTPTVLLLDGRNRVIFGTMNSNPQDSTLSDAVAKTMAAFSGDQHTPAGSAAE